MDVDAAAALVVYQQLVDMGILLGPEQRRRFLGGAHDELVCLPVLALDPAAITTVGVVDAVAERAEANPVPLAIAREGELAHLARAQHPVRPRHPPLPTAV